MRVECKVCKVPFNPRRAAAGYDTCMACGDKQASQVVRTVVCTPKGNYVLLTDREELKTLNQKPR